MRKEEAIELIETDAAWDNGELGRDENSARPVELTTDEQAAMDEAIGLQMISIRLPRSLIEDFKFLGEIHGIKYQTLMRQILARFADSEKKNLARKAASAQIKAAKQEANASEMEKKKRRKVA